jgi:hypothetical protein
VILAGEYADKEKFFNVMRGKNASKHHFTQIRHEQ